MRKNSNIYCYLLLIFYPLFFIFFFFLFLNDFYILPNNAEIPIFLLIGFAILIVCIFYFFFRFSNVDQNRIVLNFKFVNENTIKIILICLMSIAFFIHPVSFTELIMDWKQISYFNYLRAIIFLIGCVFLPGSCIFKIISPCVTLYERFKIEPIFLKITVYPLLSFTFLGIFTLVLDVIGLYRELFEYILFLTIILLIILDLSIQKLRTINLKLELIKIKISRNTLFILFLALAIIIIALGIHICSQYVIPGDSYRGISYANYVGQPDINPYSKFYELKSYNVYWGYVSFSLSVLSGIPYININAMLFPFLYLFVTSVYLLMKAILYNFKEKYAISSTIILIFFSGLFYLYNYEFQYELVSWLIYDGIFCFRYKSFAILLFITSMALFIISTKESEKTDIESINKVNNNILILGAWFLVISTIQYELPLPQSFLLIFIFISISHKKEKIIKSFFTFYLSFIIFFILLDLISGLFFSQLIYIFFFYFTGFGSIFQVENWYLNSIILYSFFFGVLLISYFIYKICIKYFSNRYKRSLNLKITSKVFFIIVLGIFITFLMIEILFNIILSIQQTFLMFYLDLFFLRIGFIGILGISLSYFCLQKNRILFYFLISWLLCTFIFASSLIFVRWFQFPNTAPNELPAKEGYLFYMMWWFERNWYYSIIPFSILSSVGLIKLKKYLLSKRSIKKINQNLKFQLNFILISILIFFSLSNTIISGIYWTNRYGFIKRDDAQMMGWISENIPSESNILIERISSEHLRDFNSYNVMKIEDEIKDALQSYLGYNGNCKIMMVENLACYQNVLKLKDNTPNGYAFFRYVFDYAQRNGSIEFAIRTTDNSKNSEISIDFNNITGINLSIRSNAFYYYDSSYHEIMEIENNTWYLCKIDFECSMGTYMDLNKSHWKITINGAKYGDFVFRNNVTQLEEIKFRTGYQYSDYDVFIDGFNFSWTQDLKIEDWIYSHIYDHLRNNKVQYYLYSKNGGKYKARTIKYIDFFDFENKLIPDFYSMLLYEYGNLIIFYAPYFDFNCVEDEGIFNATYNFKCDVSGYPPEGWTVSYDERTIIRVIDEIDGHKKVVELYDKSKGYDMVANFFSDKESGTVELWIRTTNASKIFFIDLRDRDTWAARIYFAENNFNIYGTILCNATNDKWHHIRFDFRCNDSLPYLGLEVGTYNIWIDYIKRIDGAPLNYKAGKIDNLIFMSSFSDLNYIIHFDAVGYSWDPNYEIGENYN